MTKLSRITSIKTTNGRKPLFLGLLLSFLLHLPPPLPPCLSEVQCVLLGDLLVLLQRQDDKMVLKCQSKSNIAVQEGKQMLSPIIKLDSVFLRDVATGQLYVNPTDKCSHFHCGINYSSHCFFVFWQIERPSTSYLPGTVVLRFMNW